MNDLYVAAAIILGGLAITVLSIVRARQPGMPRIKAETLLADTLDHELPAPGSGPPQPLVFQDISAVPRPADNLPRYDIQQQLNRLRELERLLAIAVAPDAPAQELPPAPRTRRVEL